MLVTDRCGYVPRSRLAMGLKSGAPRRPLKCSLECFTINARVPDHLRPGLAPAGRNLSVGGAGGGGVVVPARLRPRGRAGGLCGVETARVAHAGGGAARTVVERRTGASGCKPVCH